MGVVEERGTSTGLLQSHVECRENSWLVSVFSMVAWCQL